MIHLVFNSKSTTKQNRASVAADLRSAAYSAVFHIVVFKNIFLGKGRYSPPLEETSQSKHVAHVVPVPAFPGTLSTVPMEMRIGYVSTTPTFTRMLNAVK